MKKDVHIVDTTLRDGEQDTRKVFTVQDKFKIAKYLDDNFIYQIECGVPAMGEMEREYVKKIVAQSKNSLISTWNRLNVKDIKDSIECKPHIIHISVPTSDLQIYSNLNKDKKWIEDNLRKCIYLSKENGYETTIGFEDASRTDLKYLIELSNLVENLGVKRIRYSDTVGILSLSKTKNSIKELKKNSNLELEIHSHNDFGMALSISIEAVKYGVEYVDCTLDGIGERCGNCNLQDFLRAEKILNNNKVNYINLMKNKIEDII